MFGADHPGAFAASTRPLERTAAEIELAELLSRFGNDITSAWLENVGNDAKLRFPDIERYLRSLVSALAQAFREGDWSLTQTLIDGLAERRARMGPNLENGVQRALLAGRRALRAVDPSDGSLNEIFLEALHECVLRFSESYQGIQLATENERMNSRIIKSLVTALEARDPYTKGHSISVALMSQKLAALLPDAPSPDVVYLAGLLHDVGKVGVPDSILLKPGSLSPDEWEVVRRHPAIGAHILRPIHMFPDVIAAVLTHHENFDGSGYPAALEGAEIPVIGRLMRVTDSFHAMTSRRAYRSSYTGDDALNRLIDGAGILFDPEIVGRFVELMRTPSVVRELSLASLQIDLSESA